MSSMSNTGPGSGEPASLSAPSIFLACCALFAIYATLAAYIGVKSTNHFHAAYGPIAAKVLYCDGEGPSPLGAQKYPFKKARRTIWPHTNLPEGQMIV